jgi:outer membrane protein TolC
MYSLRLLLLIFLLLQPLLSCGCMDLRPEPVDPVPTDLPNLFSLYNADDSILPWWNSFNNAELDQLIKSGLTGNLNLMEAWARLSQVRALATKSKADQYPDLWVDGTGAHLRTDSSDSRQQTSENFGLGLSTDYEIDLWGRVQAEVRGAELDLDATREDVNGLMLSLSSMIGEAWVELLSQRQQQQQLTQELELNTKLLELIEMRFTMSRASALDVYQQGQTVTALKGGLINSRARRVSRNFISASHRSARRPVSQATRHPGRRPATPKRKLAGCRCPGRPTAKNQPWRRCQLHCNGP